MKFQKRFFPKAPLTIALAFGIASQVQAQTTGPFSRETHLTGDWGGLRNDLYNNGIEIYGSYTTEPAANVSGGLEEGATYLHNFYLELDFDFEKLFGLENTSLMVRGSERSGKSLSADYIGNTISVQQLYGGGQTHRLVEVQMSHKLFDEKVDLAYGRLTATSDFMTSPLFGEYVTNAICGQLNSPFYNMPDGLSAYPVATLGARMIIDTSEQTHLKVGVYDGGPIGPAGGDNHGEDFSVGDNGALYLAEFNYTPESGLFDLPGRYAIGGFYHSGDFASITEDIAGGNPYISGLPGKEEDSQYGIYFVFEQMLMAHDEDPGKGLTFFIAGSMSPEEEKSPMPYYGIAGLLYDGLISSRPQDKTALGLYSAWFSDERNDAYRKAGLETQNYEAGIELNHKFQVTPYLHIRPNIQYVFNPSGYREIDDALVLGIELGLVF
ncbi:carbohydrate porin [Coraliomargarita parva]|uniref:carbohydrate porin n=1 Tax=Coraliomargarita parva TaxID=3014050 RepID=UPI0022B2C300|nr:carbohydrate porin [Coraliomargarita parva]